MQDRFKGQIDQANKFQATETRADEFGGKQTLYGQGRGTEKGATTDTSFNKTEAMDMRGGDVRGNDPQFNQYQQKTLDSQKLSDYSKRFILLTFI